MKLRRVEHPRGWTSIPNETLEDSRLSWRARGILAYLLSRPANWETDSERLAAIAKEGRDAVRTSLTELERCRYLFRVKVQGAGGLWATEYVLYDRPLEAGTTPGQQPPIDLGDDVDGAKNPVDNAVDNPVENGGKPTPENPSPGPEKPTTGNPALLTTKDEQEIPLPSATDRGLAALAVESGGGDAAPTLSGSPSGLAKMAELTLDDSSAAAIADVQRRAPGVDLFALRAHLSLTLDAPATFVDARRFALAVAHSQRIDPSLLTTGVVLQAAAANVRTSTPDGVSAAGEPSGLPAA